MDSVICRPLSMHRFTLSGVTDATGVFYTNVAQFSTPAADGLFTLTDFSSGAVLGGISNSVMQYGAYNLWQFDVPAALFTITAYGGIHAVATMQLVDHANHATILHTETVELLPPRIATGTYIANSLQRITLSGIGSLDGVLYTPANTSAQITISHRSYGTVYVNAAAMTASGNNWVYDPATTVYASNRFLRVQASYWDIGGNTLFESEVIDLMPQST